VDFPRAPIFAYRPCSQQGYDCPFFISLGLIAVHLLLRDHFPSDPGTPFHHSVAVGPDTCTQVLAISNGVSYPIMRRPDTSSSLPQIEPSNFLMSWCPRPLGLSYRKVLYLRSPFSIVIFAASVMRHFFSPFLFCCPILVNYLSSPLLSSHSAVAEDGASYGAFVSTCCLRHTRLQFLYAICLNFFSARYPLICSQVMSVQLTSPIDPGRVLLWPGHNYGRLFITRILFSPRQSDYFALELSHETVEGSRASDLPLSLSNFFSLTASSSSVAHSRLLV